MRFDELDGEIKNSVQHVGANIAPSIPTSTSVKEPGGAIAPTPNTLKFDDLEGEVSNEKKTETPPTPKPEGTITSPGEGGLQLMNDVKDKYIAPIGEWAQKNIGEPISRAVDKTVFHGINPLQDTKNPGTENPIDKGDPNAVEGLMQQASSWIHGKDVKSQEMRSSIGRLVGPENIDAALKTADMVGQVPAWFALPGLPEIELAEKAPLLARFGATFANGAATGAYGTIVGNALTKGKSLTDDVLPNALVGGGFELGFAGGRKLLGLVHSDGIAALGKEIDDLPANTRSPALEQQPKLKEAGKNYEEWNPDAKYGPNPPGAIFTDEMGRKFRMSDVEDRPAPGATRNLGPIPDEIHIGPYKQPEIKRSSKTVNKASDTPKNFKPLAGFVDKEIDGPIINLHEVSVDNDGNTSIRTTKIPLKNDADAMEFNKLKNTMKDSGHEFPVNNGGHDLEDMGPLWNKSVFGEPKADVPHAILTDDKGHMSAEGMYTETPPEQLSEGDIIDTHVPGQGVQQAEVDSIKNGQIKTTDGESLHHVQSSPAPELPPEPTTKSERGDGHTVQPHEAVTPPPLPEHRTPGPSELPNSFLDNFVQGAIHLKSDIGGFIQKHFLQPSMSLGLPVNAQAIALNIHGEPTLNELRNVYMKAAISATGKQAPSKEFGEALEKFALSKSESQSSMLQELEKHPEWDAGKAWFQKALQHRTFKSTEIDNMLMRASFGPMAKEGEGLGDQYMARMYLAHMNTDWAKTAHALDLVEPAIKELMQKMPDAPEHEIRSWVDNALKGKDTFETLQAQINRGSKSFKNLKSRKNLGPATREMLGEVHDGVTRLAYSLAAQDGILAHLKNMEALSQDIEVFSKNEVPGWDKLPSTKQWGASASGYVRPDIYNAIKYNPMAQPPDSVVRKMFGVMKSWQTHPIMAGLGALTNHVFNSELLGMMGSRNANPIALTQDVATSLRALHEYAKDPLGTGPAEIVKLAKDMGVLRSYTDIYGLKDNTNRIAEKYMSALENHAFSDQPMDHVDLMKHMTKSAYEAGARTLGGINDAGKKFYNWNIQGLRLSNFIGARKELLSRDHDGLYSNLARELASSGASMMAENLSKWSRSDVENMANRLAARRVTLSTANPQTMAPIAQKVAQSTVGSGIAFTTPLAETARILSQMPVRFAKDANYRYRVAGWVTAMGSIYAARRAVQWMHGGMTPEAMDEAYKLTPDSWKGQHPFAKDMPSMYAATFKDAKGRVVFGDSSLPVQQTVEELIRSQNPKDPISTRLIQNMADHFVPGLGNSLHDVLSQAGAAEPNQSFKPRPGEGTMMRLVNTVASAANHSMAPRALNNIGQAAKGLSIPRPLSPSQEPLTGLEAVGRATGIAKPTPVGSASVLARRNEQRGQEMEAKRAIYNHNQTPEERRGAVQNYRDTVNQRNRK